MGAKLCRCSHVFTVTRSAVLDPNITDFRKLSLRDCIVVVHRAKRFPIFRDPLIVISDLIIGSFSRSVANQGHETLNPLLVLLVKLKVLGQPTQIVVVLDPNGGGHFGDNFHCATLLRLKVSVLPHANWHWQLVLQHCLCFHDVQFVLIKAFLVLIVVIHIPKLP